MSPFQKLKNPLLKFFLKIGGSLMIKRFRKFLDGRLKERTKRESLSVVEGNAPIQERYLSFAQKIRDIE